LSDINVGNHIVRSRDTEIGDWHAEHRDHGRIPKTAAVQAVPNTPPEARNIEIDAQISSWAELHVHGGTTTTRRTTLQGAHQFSWGSCDSNGMGCVTHATGGSNTYAIPNNTAWFRRRMTLSITPVSTVAPTTGSTVTSPVNTVGFRGTRNRSSTSFCGSGTYSVADAGTFSGAPSGTVIASTYDRLLEARQAKAEGVW
jgi:hypothetical protein